MAKYHKKTTTTKKAGKKGKKVNNFIKMTVKAKNQERNRSNTMEKYLPVK